MPLISRTMVGLTALATVLALTAGPALADGTPPSPQPSRPVTTQTGQPSAGQPSADQALDTVQDMIAQPPAAQVPDAAASAPAHDLTGALQQLAVTRHALAGRKRTQADRILARPTTHDGYRDTDLADYTSAEMSKLHGKCSKHFCVHWTSAADQGQRVCFTDGSCRRLDNHATVDTAKQDLKVLEYVFRVEVGRYGFRQPLRDRRTTNTANRGNPDPRFDVFLVDVGDLGYYGYTAVSRLANTSPRRASAYLVLDNTFGEDKFCPAGVDCTSPGANLRVTIAHEFFHAIQYNYDIDESTWLLEGSAVWMEDRVYDSINDYRQYAAHSPIRQPRVPVDDDGRRNPVDVYGAFTLFKFLDGWLRDPAAVRQVWSRAGRRGVDSLQAVVDVLRSHGKAPRAAFGRFGVWNTLSPSAYPGEAGGLGPSGVWRRANLTGDRPSTGWQEVRLRHLASAPLVLTPGSGVSGSSRLRITAHLPWRSHGPVATVQVRRTSGSDSVRTVPLNKYGDGRLTVRFSPRSVREVVVVLTNGSTTMIPCRSSSDPYRCGGRGKYDGETYRVHARVLP